MLPFLCFNVVKFTIVKIVKPQFYKSFKTVSLSTRTTSSRKMSAEQYEVPKTADSSYDASQDLFGSEPMDIDVVPTNETSLNDDIPTNEVSSKNDAFQVGLSPKKISTNEMSTNETSTNDASQHENPSPSKPSNDKSLHWRGYPVADFNSTLRLKPIRPNSATSSERHVVCVEFGKYKDGTVPRPFPASGNGLPKDCWDGQHVRMPFSPENLFPVFTSNGRKEIQKRYINNVIFNNTNSYIIAIKNFGRCIVSKEQ